MPIIKPDNANAVTFAILGIIVLIPGIYGPFMTVFHTGFQLSCRIALEESSLKYCAS